MLGRRHGLVAVTERGVRVGFAPDLIGAFENAARNLGRASEGLGFLGVDAVLVKSRRGDGIGALEKTTEEAANTAVSADSDGN